MRRVGTKIFICSLFRSFPTYFGLKWSSNGIFEFFCYFFGIFYYGSGTNGTEREFLFSLFLCLLQQILAWNEVIMVFFNFLNFFAIFLKFSLTRRVGTERNDEFNFLTFSAFSNLFWLERKTYWYFLIFWIFLLYFSNFLLRVWLERNGTIIFIFSLSLPFPTCFGQK